MTATLPARDADRDPVGLASPPESVSDRPKWALMALDPSGKRQLLVRQLVSGIESDAMVFRELAGGGGDNDIDIDAGGLSVAKWNKKPFPPAKMARGSREVRVAKMLAGSAAARRFAALLAAQDMRGGYRESWWRHYNLGDMHDVVSAGFRGSQAPASLVFRWVAQCLEGIACLDGELGARHMDLHPGNVFFHTDGGDVDAVLGDFGQARLAGERPPVFSSGEEELSAMGAEGGRAARMSPPLSLDEAKGDEDYSWRTRWDARQFLDQIANTLMNGFGGGEREEAGDDLLLAGFFASLEAMVARDEADRRLPERQRPPLQDLAPLVRDAWELSRLCAWEAADGAAARQVRANLLAGLAGMPSGVQVFDSEGAARDAYERHVGAGMLRVVDLSDDGRSVRAAAAELAAFKVAGTAWVAPPPSTSSTPATSGAAEERPLALVCEELVSRYAR
ncbi:hypothetical protein KVR01_003176 [Diaporthe batatas]|uniref:uncharacterized protein n=1 Tax=Diaporthe batatas TaxID=748121 RepID=UPI001D03AE8A|nr:uncharacterized protein KVR01_003176 [Diaporthe batatas]KAG8167487.1 hypothetical protein KVR01_003176 [Diaporthe batatas]